MSVHVVAASVVRNTCPPGNAAEPAEHGIDGRRVVRIERDARDEHGQADCA